MVTQNECFGAIACYSSLTGANLDRCSITSFGRSITTANFDRNTASRSSHTPGSTCTRIKFTIMNANLSLYKRVHHLDAEVNLGAV